MEKQKNSIRLVTLNTWKGDGLYSWRFQLMAEELFLLRPDILCLQEAVRSDDGQIDTAGFFSDFLKMKCIYAPARHKKRPIEGTAVDCHSGLAILTTAQIEKHWIDTIPVADEDPERMALTARLQINNRKYTITNVHLTHLPGEDALRTKQFFTILEKVQAAAEMSGWFCCGDFNFEIGPQQRARLEKELPLKITDCYLEAGGQLPGATFPAEPSPSGQKRIDYLFSLTGESLEQINCLNSDVVLTTCDFTGDYPSDHYGVSVDFSSHSI